MVNPSDPYADSYTPSSNVYTLGGSDAISAGNHPPSDLSGGNLTVPPPPTNYGGGGGIPWDKMFDNTLGNRQLDQSQQYLNYMTGNYYPFEQTMQQNVFDLQKQLQQAQMTGDYNGVQTLQSKLQQAQISLQNFQANQQASMQNAQMSGVYNGAPTLEAQQMMNTGALNQGNQYLTARGQDTTYDQSLMGMATNFANIQAQMAQSPLVAWYTARGLAPPQSALMASNFQQTLAQTPQFQGLGQYQAPQLNWSFKDTQPGVGMLPTATNAGAQYAPTGQPINFQNPTGGGYGSPTALMPNIGGPQMQPGYTPQPNMLYPGGNVSGQLPTVSSPNAALGAPTVSPTNVQVPPSAPPAPTMPTNSWMQPTEQMGAQPTMQPSMQPYAAPPPNYDPSMSQGPAPWASSLAGGTTMPLYAGNNGGMNVASAQQWATMNPQEQQAAAQAAAMMGNPNYAQNVYQAAPEWGGLAPAQYQGY